MIEILKQGLQLIWKHKKMWLLLYAIVFLFAAFVASPFKKYLENKVGHSLMIDDIIKGFNYTFINDFMNAYGDGISPILHQSYLSIILFLLLFIFLMGGILSLFKEGNHENNRSLFWGQSAHFFWRMLRLSIYFIIIHFVVFLIFISIFMTITKGLNPLRLESEGIIFSSIKYLTPIYLLVASFFMMWQDYAKIFLIHEDKKYLIQPIKKSFQFIIKNIKKTWGLYLINLGLLLIVMIINYFITTSFNINSNSSILISFIISQIFVFSRLGLKLLNLSTATLLYQKIK